VLQTDVTRAHDIDENINQPEDL